MSRTICQDPPPLGDRLDRVLVLTGNIIPERPYGPGGEAVRRGTRQFRAGAKVYLARLKFWWTILESGESWGRICVVGQQRQSRQWIECWVRTSEVRNWRIQVLCQPGALKRLREADWPGFWLREDDFSLGEERDSPAVIRAFMEAVGRRFEAEYWRRNERRKSTATQLEITLPQFITSPEELRAVAEQLHWELQKRELGYVSGYGVSSNSSILSCDVTKAEIALPVLRSILLELHVPK